MMKLPVSERTRVVGGLVLLVCWISSRVLGGSSLQIDTVLIASAVAMLASTSPSVGNIRNKLLTITAIAGIAVCLAISIKENAPKGWTQILPPVQPAAYLVGCMLVFAWKVRESSELI
ncbi:hypothetical protein MCEMSE15_01463 [Fimbriimonadaceae bacterium]